MSRSIPTYKKKIYRGEGVYVEEWKYKKPY